MGETYYELLGVSEDASSDEIERAYRERLKETHPDVNDSDDASDRTKQLLEARETLTDKSKRQRYDRRGHEAYVNSEYGDQASTTTGTGSTGRTQSRQTTTTDKRRRRNRARKRTSQSRNATNQSSQRRTTSTENVGSGAAWAQTNSRKSERQQSQTQEDNERSWRVWSTDRAYAVKRGKDALRFGGLFKNERALVLLGTTFLVYPVLLYGALNPTFPLAVNLLVAACIIFVIAFLQSIPEVGLVVFGGWTFLLPPMLLVTLGLDVLSIQTILALTAVIFPFGLSALTRIAIRPVSAG